jgi:uncharacterized protein (DUF302 family)
MEHSDYAFFKVVNYTFDNAVEKVTEGLTKEGFGILTEIDVSATLKKKLDVEFRPYKILGACNPSFAYESLKKEEQIGLMLPCNIIIYENNNKEIVVAAIDPIASMKAVQNESLIETASLVQNKLKKVIGEL